MKLAAHQAVRQGAPRTCDGRRGPSWLVQLGPVREARPVCLESERVDAAGLRGTRDLQFVSRILHEAEFALISPWRSFTGDWDEGISGMWYVFGDHYVMDTTFGSTYLGMTSATDCKWTQW